VTPVIRAQGLTRRYGATVALDGVDLDIPAGRIVGLIGPNGAGKTTTIKCLLGLCAPTAGAARIRGLDAREPRARESVGFLPENPYVYPYLTPREFVDLCARLSGMTAHDRKDRVPRALERTGIAWAADRPVHRLSKGMLQRTGLAAALVADPELLVLDEPMSGLDPLGRREVRDLIFEERAAGRTVLFSSHVLSDVEALCDRVVILNNGEVVVSGAVSDLIHAGATLAELTLRGVHSELRAQLTERATLLREMGDSLVLEVEGDAVLGELIALALQNGAKLVSAIPRKDSLEDLFVRAALRTGDARNAALD
jgi:ABC-2 type transport system ATP-binding protein